MIVEVNGVIYNTDSVTLRFSSDDQPVTITEDNIEVGEGDDMSLLDTKDCFFSPED